HGDGGIVEIHATVHDALDDVGRERARVHLQTQGQRLAGADRRHHSIQASWLVQNVSSPKESKRKICRPWVTSCCAFCSASPRKSLLGCGTAEDNARPTRARPSTVTTAKAAARRVMTVSPPNASVSVFVGSGGMVRPARDVSMCLYWGDIRTHVVHVA